MVNNKCCVPFCRVGYPATKKFKSVEKENLFTVPKDADLLQKWEKKIMRGPLKPTDRVCAKHFPENEVIRFEEIIIQGEIVRLERLMPKLKTGAIPTIFPGYPPYLQESTISFRTSPKKRKILELKSYSISETMNFREKYMELINKMGTNSKCEMGVDQEQSDLYRSTAEKIERKHEKIIAELGHKKSKADRRDMPALLPLHLPEDHTTVDRKPIFDVKPGLDVAFVFRVYPPFTYDPSVRCPRIRSNMEIVMLGHQTLNMLCDKIVCRDSYMEAGGDISDTPDIPVRMRLGEKYRSRMLYIGNTFYVDRSDPNSKDYSETIRKWGSSHDLEFGEALDMHQETCLDLVARIGFPYVFQHLGGCEHLFRIEYARLIEPKDCLESHHYPFYNYLARSNPKASLCMACLEVSQWIVFNSARMISNPSFLCNSCFQSYHYIDGEKIGSFSAVRYWDCPLFADTFDVAVDGRNTDDEEGV